MKNHHKTTERVTHSKENNCTVYSKSGRPVVTYVCIKQVTSMLIRQLGNSVKYAVC